jgi:hypothetical protein
MRLPCPHPTRLRDVEETLHELVFAKTELWLGRREDGPADPLTLEEMIGCLKILQKSLRFWSKEKGRQGYLTYIASFFP